MALLQSTPPLEAITASGWLAALIGALAALALALQHLLYRRRLRGLRELVRRAESEAASRLERDPLTGLLSRAALEKRLQEGASEPGVVTVADLDEFKRLNELLGHLGGDEILRAIGRLIQLSIRQEDLAYRWGGDEFVIVFRNVDPERARLRMDEIEQRLSHFQIRSYGEVAIGLSWGVAATAGRTLRESLDEADRAMYVTKRGRSSTEF